MAAIGVTCRCLSPKRIVNPYTGSAMIVPCGHCKSCVLNKNNHMSFLCDLEAKQHKYCMFITLTYAQRFVPRATLCDSLMDFYDYELVSEDGEYLGSVCMSEEMKDKLLEKFHVFGYVPYLRKDDLQKFFKRFRYFASKISDAKVRYFACGEYGPVHYRPHFHVLLFFSDEALLQACEQIVLQSWRYGRVDVQVSKGECSRYVAGYVNSSCSLPKVFESRAVRPFCLHSQRMGQGFLQGERQKVYELTPDDFIKRSIVLDGTFKEFSLWRSCYSYFFPKCRGFFDKSSSSLYFSYTLYEVAKRCFPCAETCFDLAKEIAFNAYTFDTAIRLKAFGSTKDERDMFDLLSYFRDTSVTDLYSDSGDRYVHRIYTELLVSKHFLTYVCDRPSVYEINRKIRLIKEFYSRLDYLHLLDFFENQKKFFESDLFDSGTLKEFGSDNWFYPYIYDNVEYSAAEYYSMPAYRVMREDVCKIYQDRQKHKYLNDKNGIFLQENMSN